MNQPRPTPEEDDAIKDLASLWVVRHDRGLTAEEQAAFSAWVSQPEHAAAFAHARRTWGRYSDLGQLADNLERTPAAPPRSARHAWLALGGVAAAVALGIWTFLPRASDAPEPIAAAPAAAHPEPVVRLTDGSVAKLRDAASITPTFSAAERRVDLSRGEAFFVVAADASRPFYVSVNGEISVRAIGTAFSVRADPQEVKVLVSEGTVEVTSRQGEALTLTASHSATLTRETGRAAVETLSAAQVASRLAWSDTMTSFDGATLAELIERYGRRQHLRIEISDPALGAVRIGGQLPTEDFETFLHALEVLHDVVADRPTPNTMVLRRRSNR